MASPRIIFNGINLDLTDGLTDYAAPFIRRAQASTSDGGVTETVRMGAWQEVLIAMERFPSLSLYESLQAWWSWASQGKQWAFAFDSAKTVNTTLVNNESAGATVIELTSTTGIVAAQKYLMRSADLTKWEIVTVQSISAGVSVTLSAGTKYAYSSADLFRDPDYFPKLISLDDSQPFKELPALIYSMAVRAREDRG